MEAISSPSDSYFSSFSFLLPSDSVSPFLSTLEPSLPLFLSFLPEPLSATSPRRGSFVRSLSRVFCAFLSVYLSICNTHVHTGDR